MIVATIGALGVSVGVASPAVAGGKAGFGCPRGFDVGAVTLQEALALPRVQAAFAAGVYDEAAVVADFNAVDRNANGVVCVKDVSTLTGEAGGALAPYLYNVIDDNAAAGRGR